MFAIDYIIGIDQGRSKTHTALATAGGRILCHAKAPGAEHHADGVGAQRAFLRRSIEALPLEFQMRDVAAIGGGLTGIDFPGEDRLFEDFLSEMCPNGRINCENDVIATMKGGSMCTYGAAVCCGSGANVAIISPSGESFVYGYFLEPDLHGGGSLTGKGIQAVVSADAGVLPPTMLTERVLGFFGVPTVLDLLIANAEGRIGFGDMKDLPVQICECAELGDEVSIDILGKMGRGLADAVGARARRFGMTDVRFETVLSGSIFKGPGTHLSDAIRERLAETCPLAEVIDAKYEPVVGGVIMALELLYGRIPPEVLRELELSAERLGLIRTRTM